MSKRIGLFGGTFDPVHNGHVAIVNSFLSSNEIDELWVVLTPFPPHKQDKEHASYDHRKHMLDLAFCDHTNVLVSTVEKQLPKPSYTIQTLKYLQSKYDDVKFYLCIGEDSLVNFDKWKDNLAILERCELLVAERPGISHKGTESNILKKTHFIAHEPVEASSTSVRSLLSLGRDVKHLLPQKVYKYINEHHLYQ